MPTITTQEYLQRLEDIDFQLSKMPKATGKNRLLGSQKWTLYAERRKIRMLIAKTKGDHTSKQWEQMLQKSNHTCTLCGARKSYFKDHIVPISKGGSNHISNIQVLCGSCSSKKGNR